MRWGPFVLLAVVLQAGCSRPATVEECEYIVRRVAELRLRSTVGRSADARKQADALTRQLENEIRKECVGMPLTDGAMACVRRATTPRQVIECFH
jgi:hypothetical protein